jgi:hypothetical protein
MAPTAYSLRVADGSAVVPHPATAAKPAVMIALRFRVRRFMSRFLVLGFGAALACAQRDAAATRPTGAATRAATGDTRPSVASEAKPFKFVVPGSAYKLAFVPLPPTATGGKTLWMATTEIPWDVYDVYVFANDVKEGEADLDGVTRPSKPYIPPDRGFGHQGWPAISISFRGADFFSVWLSKRTGGTFRLPTEAEFEAAALAGAKGRWCVGDDERALLDYAWTKDNAEVDGRLAPHRVGTKKANAFGLHDLHGNVAEWCVAADGRGVTKGGHYEDGAADVAAASRRPYDKSWQMRDPQIPKSKWWLSDGPFVGFRVVCETVPTNVRIEP